MSPRATRGFTLIELVVVLAIITVILATALTSQSSFNKTLLLANTAYDIALTIRSAETYGLGTRVSGPVSNIGYGVHFSRSTPNQFGFFADSLPGSAQFGNCHGVPPGGAGAPDAIPGNCQYDSGESYTPYNLNNGMTITNFCVYGSVPGGVQCASSHGSNLSSLDIVFARPNPATFVSTDYTGYAPGITSVCLTVASSQGATRSVTVNAAGLIEPSIASCP